MKKILSILIAAFLILCTAFITGCSQISELEGIADDVQDITSELSDIGRDPGIEETEDSEPSVSDSQYSDTDIKDTDNQNSATSGKDENSSGSYTMADIAVLENTENFAEGTLEHIFDGTINKKGKATGYHYTMVSDSKGKIIEGTRSDTDENGVFTGKVKVSGKQKKGFSSFYPESWSPQQVVDAINTAYDDALSDPDNPRGSLWIGHYGELEIDMYMNSSKKITTAYPIYKGD